MVLGLKAKSRRGPCVHVEYLIHVQEIKPWPPTQSLKNVRSAMIQWEKGDSISGSTSTVSPSINDGKIEFNESFRLNFVLSRDMSVKNGDTDVFQKNLLEFNMYEPRRDQTVKGQLLGTAIIDLADYGVVKEIISIGAPMNCTRSFRNTVQPILHLKIQPYYKTHSSSSLRGRLEKEASLDKSVGDSVSTLMSEEYADEAEAASLSDDDVLSQSSLTASSVVEFSGGSPSVILENGSSIGKNTGASREIYDSVPKLVHRKSDVRTLHTTPALPDTSVLVPEFNHATTLVPGTKGGVQSKTKSEDDAHIIHNKGVPIDISSLNSDNDAQHEAPSENENEHQTHGEDSGEVENGDKHGHYRHQSQALVDEKHLLRADSSYRSSMDSSQHQVMLGSDSPMSRDKLKHIKSVRSSMDFSRSNGTSYGTVVKQDPKFYPAEKGRTTTSAKAQELEQRIAMLEDELKEAAALEIAVYSVVADHVSSVNKVHAPARRLSRLYLQASKDMRASAAHSAVAGLVVVAKACGNDVPRLTFWLSNCIVLRAIISKTFVEQQNPLSAEPSAKSSGITKGMNKESSILKWNVSSDKRASKKASSFEDWGNPHAFVSALEKVESWIFSRVVESIWWQTLTPYMQSSATKVVGEVKDSGCNKFCRRTSSSGNHEQVNLSLELWKKAFKDACERLCPIRAEGHECGCLPLLAKLIMEQCVARLDVAMFNAILRESADDMPTDPISDPISDAMVLPIPAGRSSFGAGAQLKNAIGNWSRCLTDLFGMDDDDAPEDEREDDDDEIQRHDSSFKSFHLLKSLSDLMMLPKDMLLSESIRSEVCPALSVQVIKRVLDNFVPDEFCLDPIPDAVIESLNSETVQVDKDLLIANFPFAAPAVSYTCPSVSSLISLIDGNMEMGRQFALRRSGSVLRRSNTSDDELDELDSPLNSITCDIRKASPKEVRPDCKLVQNLDKKPFRYQLLREIWGYRGDI